MVRLIREGSIVSWETICKAGILDKINFYKDRYGGVPIDWSAEWSNLDALGIRCKYKVFYIDEDRVDVYRVRCRRI